ncbi:MAG: phosphatidylserine decarboxylase [Gammaproteobacteria bacterium]|nr:phosphatidylserine decarboxylase [Gammaproteobacteria bacterium]MDH5800731.1 phosphatidylserine decarboxylase [Gammaproteobacteria bacterium]
MVNKRYPLVAREAWLVITVLVLVSFTVHYALGVIVAIPLWLLTLGAAYLFRDPNRPVPPKPLAVVSPVDGTVLAVETVDASPYTDAAVVKICLRMGPADVYTIRSPMEGKVLKQWLPREHTESQAGCDRFAQWVQSDEQDDVILTVKPSHVLKRPHCYVHSGERVGQGQRCGIAPFGAIVDVYVPNSSRIETQKGDRVHAGSDTLATLVH